MHILFNYVLIFDISLSLIQFFWQGEPHLLKSDYLRIVKSVSRSLLWPFMLFLVLGYDISPMLALLNDFLCFIFSPGWVPLIRADSIGDWNLSLWYNFYKALFWRRWIYFNRVVLQLIYGRRYFLFFFDKYMVEDIDYRSLIWYLINRKYNLGRTNREINLRHSKFILPLKTRNN